MGGRQGGGAFGGSIFKLHGLEERTEQKFHVVEGACRQPAYRGWVVILNDQMGTECSPYRNSRAAFPFHLFIRPEINQ